MEERQIWELLSSNMIGLSIFLFGNAFLIWVAFRACLLYTSPSPRDFG